MTLDPRMREALGDFHSSANAVGVPLVVIGAVARDFALELHGAEPMRATLDIDVTVRLSSWTVLDGLVEAACESGRFRETESPHRLKHMNSIPIDVIPHGGVETSPGTIDWPRDGGQMNVAGFDCIRASRERLSIDGAVDIAVADLPSLAFMKCFAFFDRGGADAKDLHDLVGLLRARTENLSDEDYLRIGESDPSFDDSVGRYGAFLIGDEVRSLLGQSLVHEIVSKLADVHDPQSTVVDRAVPSRTLDPERALLEVSGLLKSFRDGLISPRP